MSDAEYECSECGAPSPPTSTRGCDNCDGQGDIVPKGTLDRDARRVADAIEGDLITRTGLLTPEERRASVVRQLRRGDNALCRRVLELIGEA